LTMKQDGDAERGNRAPFVELQKNHRVLRIGRGVWAAKLRVDGSKWFKGG
jgi:hypothetical protein